MFVPLGMRKFSALLTAFMATAVSEMALSQMASPVKAGPVVCTTTLEAPDPSAGSGLVPVEVTTCGVALGKPAPQCSTGGCTPGQRPLSGALM